jgi:peptidoglycan/xylan/chitin deacetylase (PgdA/CDA1 family)
MVWKIPSGIRPTVYLTFDDGPHPTATPFVLEQLKRYDAKATFFCIGKNVVEYPDVYAQILEAGHRTGNHTQHHLNGWDTDTEQYIADIIEASKHIDSRLFRPPYGRIKKAQAYMLTESKQPWTLIMWDVLSADFDIKITPEQCLENVLKHIKPGSIVVFHDSVKAWDRMSHALPGVLEYCKQQGWAMEAISL